MWIKSRTVDSLTRSPELGKAKLSRSRALLAIFGGTIGIASGVGTATAMVRSPLSGLPPKSTLRFGTWTRRRTAVSVAMEEVKLTFPALDGRGASRAHLSVPAISKPDIDPCGCCGATPHRSSSEPFTRHAHFSQFVKFGAGVEPLSVTLAREAGTFLLLSYHTASNGSASFLPNASYVAFLADRGLNTTPEQQLSLALLDVTASYAIAAKSAFPDIDADLIAGSRLGGLRQESFAELRRGYPAMRAAELRQFLNQPRSI